MGVAVDRTSKLIAALIVAAFAWWLWPSSTTTQDRRAAAQSCADFDALTTPLGPKSPPDEHVREYPDGVAKADDAASRNDSWQSLANGWHAFDEGSTRRDPTEMAAGMDAIRAACESAGIP